MFSSDNGYYLGEHNLGDKRSAYEESLRAHPEVVVVPDHEVALTRVADPTMYGLVRLGRSGAIAQFVEKPSADEVENGWAMVILPFSRPPVIRGMKLV